MNQYQVEYSFTTVHAGSRFVGRSGVLYFETEDDINEVNKEIGSVKNLCFQYIMSKKPKWNVFSIEIKSIAETAPK